MKWRVRSYSDSDEVYVVSISSEMTWGCSCPVWKFRRQECKHIHEIKTMLQVQEDDGTMMKFLALLIEKMKKHGKTDEEIVEIIAQKQAAGTLYSDYDY